MVKLLPQLKLKHWFFIFGFSLFFLWLASLHLTRLPIFVDEAIYLRWAQIAWHDASWRFISLTDGKQPLYIWFVIPFMKLFADPLYAGRMASVVAGLMTVLGMGYLTYLLSGKRRTAFIALLLTTFSPYLFFYYRFGIMESLLVASSIWTVIFSVLLARTKRLDIALILGMVAGLTLLVKSSALFFILLIPFAYILEFNNFKQLFSKSTLHYLLLVLVSIFLAFVIYNIQRLSPWMHMIKAKNAFFTVPYSQIFAEPQRLLNNFLDVWRWQIHYSSLPIFILFIFGIILTLKVNWRVGLYLLALLFIPVLGTVAVAKLFAPRYIIYATPFVLLFASFVLGSFKSNQLRWFSLTLSLVVPLLLIIKLIDDPVNFPYANVDGGYVNGWSAGQGVKEIADWAVLQAQDHPLTIFTEGTFGILPHGLELYVNNRTHDLTIIGIYPIDHFPPTQVIEYAKSHPYTYLLMNNTPIKNIPNNLELIQEYFKLEPAYSMRLYQFKVGN